MYVEEDTEKAQFNESECKAPLEPKAVDWYVSMMMLLCWVEMYVKKYLFLLYLFQNYTHLVHVLIKYVYIHLVITCIYNVVNVCCVAAATSVDIQKRNSCMHIGSEWWCMIILRHFLQSPIRYRTRLAPGPNKFIIF